MVGGAVAAARRRGASSSSRSKEPIIPLGLFKNRTFTLSVVASISVGVAMFGTSVFLSQYMQLARGATPTESGLLTIPMMAGLLIASTVVGALISRRGKWKAFMVIGSRAHDRRHAPAQPPALRHQLLLVGVSMFVLGAGVGMVMQNLVLVVQNATDGARTWASPRARSRSSAASAARSASRSWARSSARSSPTTSRAACSGSPPEQQLAAAQTLGGGAIPQVGHLPDFLRVIVETAYGTGVGDVFLAAVPLAIITLIAVMFLPNVRPRHPERDPAGQDRGSRRADEHEQLERGRGRRRCEAAEGGASSTPEAPQIDAAAASVGLAPPWSGTAARVRE